MNLQPGGYERTKLARLIMILRFRQLKRKTRCRRGKINSISLEKSLNFLEKAAVLLKQIADELSRLFKSCQAQVRAAENRIAELEAEISSIVRGRNVPNNGSAEYILRSKITLSESHDAAGRCPSRVYSDRACESLMSDDDKIHVDATRPARLHNGTAWAGGKSRLPRAIRAA